MKALKLLLLLLPLMLLVAACSNQKATAKKYHRLNLQFTPSTTETRNFTLVVKRPKALSILGGRPMVATQDDESLVQLSHNFWLDSPKVLLQDILKKWATGKWQNVSYQAPTAQPHQILDTRILAFEKQQNQANVKIEFMLYNEDSQLIFNQVLADSVTLDGAGYQAYVRATTLAIGNILDQLNEQLQHVH